MTIRLVLTAVLLLAPTLSLALAQPEPVSIDRLVEQLGSVHFAEREAASRALNTLGEPALAVLRRARSSPDAEISRRAKQLVTQIDGRLENARLLLPQRIRLVYKETNVLDAIADVARKTGIPVEFEGNRSNVSGRKITLDTGEVSVWNALEQFLQAAGLAERLNSQAQAGVTGRVMGQNAIFINANGRMVVNEVSVGGQSLYDTRVAVTDGKQPRFSAYDAGAVRIRALPQAASAKPLVRGTARVNLEITPQPSLPWHGVLDVRILHAVDEHGQELTQTPRAQTAQVIAEQLWARNGAVFVVNADGMEPVYANRVQTVDLQGGTKPVGTLTEVRGVILAQNEVGPEPLVTVENVLQSVGRVFSAGDGTRIQVLKAERTTGGQIVVAVEMHNQVEEDAALMFLAGAGRRRNGFSSGQDLMDMLAARWELVDSAGQRMARSKAATFAHRGNPQQIVIGFPPQVEITFEPRAGQADASQLVYSGKRTVILQIPFILKNVPQP